MKKFTKRGPRRNASERRAILAEHEVSGLTLHEFAIQSGIPMGTLASWRWKERRAAKSEAAALIPVTLISDPAPASPSIDPASCGAITIETAAGHRVSIPSRLSDKTLRMLMVEALRC